MTPFRRRWLGLALWLLGMLAPVAWLVRGSAAAQRMFDSVFGPVWMHILTHAFLFGVLAAGLAAALAPRWHGRQQGLRIGLAAWLLALTAGVLQEGIQLATTGRMFGSPEWFDLGVDAVGAGLGLALWGWRRRRQAEAGAAAEIR